MSGLHADQLRAALLKAEQLLLEAGDTSGVPGSRWVLRVDVSDYRMKAEAWSENAFCIVSRIRARDLEVAGNAHTAAKERALVEAIRARQDATPVVVCWQDGEEELHFLPNPIPLSAPGGSA